MYLDMPLEEAMTTQRAIRRLKADAVDDDLVLHLIELALKAPVGSNAQNWEFVVVKDRDKMAQIGAVNRAAYRVYSWIGRRLMRDNAKMMRTFAATDYQAEHFAETPVLIVPCLKGIPPPFPLLGSASFFASIYPAVQNLLLAARAAGLGANLITLPLWNVWRVRRILGLPLMVTPCAFVPLGWPLGRYGPTTRRPVGEVVHLDRYGNRAFR
jgi:nitroreductase